MLLATTSIIEGRRIVGYRGLVAGQAILGANVFRDIFASIRDIVGGRSTSYERVLSAARKTALDDMTGQAHVLGANAVIGIDIDYQAIGESGSMLMVSVSRTAVTLE
jgi:uncharacterized protein YbjQ (UPF0145 family)